MTVTNRILWIVIGLLLAAAGAAAVLVSAGWMPGTDRDVTLLTDAMSRRWRDWGGWALAGVIVAGVIVAALGIWLMSLELRQRGGRALPTVVFRPAAQAYGDEGRLAAGNGHAAGGRTQVDTSVLSNALKYDLQLDPLVKRASVRLTGSVGKPALYLRLQVTRDADMVAVRANVAAALARFRTTTDLSPTLRETVIKVS